jgi:hypothetical protein
MITMTRSAVLIVLIGLAASCASEPADVTPADYLDALELVCIDTTATIDALPQPPEQITVTDFATSAANALDDEAERVRALDAPGELVADHRAFILNTDDQATTWRSIATADDDRLDGLTVRLGELIRGRNDLVDEMNAPGCRRGDV